MLYDAEHQHIVMVSLGDEQDLWAPRGRDWTEPWQFLPFLQHSQLPWEGSRIACETTPKAAVHSAAVSAAEMTQHKQEPQKKDGDAASGSQARISPYNLLALPTVLVHTGAERHRG